VHIYRYVTEGSFDSGMWQALGTKARFIGQVITGDNAARRAEDIGSQELSYAEVKTIVQKVRTLFKYAYESGLIDKTRLAIDLAADDFEVLAAFVGLIGAILALFGVLRK
jgi:hypothetical protein